MRTTTIDVTPAGNGLFQVDLRDDAGATTHEVAVPDEFAERFGDHDEVALQDVVLATMEWRLEQEPREKIPAAFSLADLQGRGDFDSRMPAIARDRATGMSAPTEQQRAERTHTDSDDRLVEEVKQEQEEGVASTPRQRI